MRLVVFSDTHGNFRAAREIVERNENVYTFIFLGDGEREIDKLRIVYPEKMILNVAGNCDYNSFTPNSDLYNAGKVKVLFTHGHRFNVKYGTDMLLAKAKEVGAEIALFGHTHERYYKYVVKLFSPVPAITLVTDLREHSASSIQIKKINFSMYIRHPGA